MLEQNAGVNFFLKTPKNRSSIRTVYLRVTIDGISKEASTKKKWNTTKWDQKRERAAGSKEDARTLNFFLDSLVTRINQYTTDQMNNGSPISAKKLIDFAQGKTVSRATLVQEFQLHNDEMFALVPKGDYAIGTHEIFVRTQKNIVEFIKLKYQKEDFEFRELNFEFIKDYEFFLKTVKNCNNNTALKYIGNVKKIVFRALAKEIIHRDPFMLFKSKKTKPNKKPLTADELRILEEKQFSTERLTVVRDIFVFQCYTGLAYIDAYQLKKTDIKLGDDGTLWIMSSRQKSKSQTDIPLLPKAIEIMEKYKNHPICITRNTVLPVSSNQKMNEYLKEIGSLCGINTVLNTHRARRTFASTVTLKNGVPIHIVKELLGHYSVKQTEEYAITEQETVGIEMNQLRKKLNESKNTNKETIDYDPKAIIEQIENAIILLMKHNPETNATPRIVTLLNQFNYEIEKLKNTLT